MSAGPDDLDLPPYVRDKTDEVLEGSVIAMRLALDHGVPVAAGTDAGAPAHPHGMLADELDFMVDAGATPTQALHFATAAAAELLRIDDQVGTLEPGKRADVTVVNGDATTDISCIRDIELVIKDGAPAWSRRRASQHTPSSSAAPR